MEPKKNGINVVSAVLGLRARTVALTRDASSVELDSKDLARGVQNLATNAGFAEGQSSENEGLVARIKDAETTRKEAMGAIATYAAQAGVPLATD